MIRSHKKFLIKVAQGAQVSPGMALDILVLTLHIFCDTISPISILTSPCRCHFSFVLISKKRLHKHYQRLWDHQLHSSLAYITLLILSVFLHLTQLTWLLLLLTLLAPRDSQAVFVPAKTICTFRCLPPASFSV